MNKYKKIGLKDEELFQGKLSAIMNAVRQEFKEYALNSNTTGEKVWAQIYFENNLEQAFYDKYPEESDVLYVNEPAMHVLTKRKVSVRVIGDASELPAGYGNVISMPVRID